MSRRAFFVTAILVALLLAGVGSYYASSDPDGLERVAEETGFADSAEDSRTADSPFADYGTEGVDDQRLGGGIAGVAGVLVTLLLMGGLAYAVRRRGRDDDLGADDNGTHGSGGTGGTDDAHHPAGTSA